MKKIICLILFALVISCDKDQTNAIDNESEIRKEFKFNRLVNSAIAIEDKGKVKLNVSDEVIMSTFKKYANRHSPELTPESFEVVEIDEKQYLRFYSKNNIVSTIALIKDDNGQFRTGNTVCESVACANGGGCIPNGLYCTRCTPPDTQPGEPKGDCKRSTSGGGPVIEE